MIVTDYYTTRSDGVILNRTYSDTGYYIERDGIQYVDAIDPEGEHREYAETDVPIVTDDEATAEDYEAALNEMGVEL